MSIFSLNPKRYRNIDKRLKPFLKGWKLIEKYKGKTVIIPGTWNSKIYPYKYFKVIKKKGDDNYSPNGEEDEIGLCLECGWKGYDAECIINLFITGSAVNSGGPVKIGAEILKAGGAPMKLYYNDQLITNFTKYHRTWWSREKRNADKIWKNDMRKYL